MQIKNHDVKIYRKENASIVIDYEIEAEKLTEILDAIKSMYNGQDCKLTVSPQPEYTMTIDWVIPEEFIPEEIYGYAVNKEGSTRFIDLEGENTFDVIKELVHTVHVNYGIPENKIEVNAEKHYNPEISAHDARVYIWWRKV